MLKFEHWLYHREMSPKGADRMAKSVDPDQTHFDLDPTLFVQAYLFENLGLLWYSIYHLVKITG